MESILVPYHATTMIPCTRALVFAPHPDDEVFGCGGAIMRHVEQGVPVRVIVVSDGTYGASEEKAAEFALQRRNESIAAAQIMGYGMPVFWHYPDRQISYSEKLIQEILTAIREADADLVYAPSVLEMHPDHRALGMAAVEAVRRIGNAVNIALYEVGIPLHPGVLLDISDLTARKAAAMECFISQNTKQRYDQHIAALNRYRTYTLPSSITAAEAFMLIPAEELANDPLKLYQSEHTRQKALGLILDSSDMPLVSVIIRSMDRPALSDALDSIALQTYPNIEVVIVNAKGQDHRKLGEWCGRFPLRTIENNEPLDRSRAANTGLHSAKGSYLIFLDDDDLFYPEHITNLVTALQNHPSAQCVYSGVRVEHYVDQQLQHVTAFNEPYDQHRLWGRNFIPIHAMLFERSLVTSDHCGFDENLKVFEDWDFWIQLSQHTQILHIDTITAIYRNHGHSGLGSKQDKAFLKESRSKVYDKWKMLLTGEQLEDLIQYREDLIQCHEDLISSLRSQLAHNEHLLASLQNQLTQAAIASAQREQSLQKTISDLQKTIHDLFHSSSWRITAPLRFLVRTIRGQHHEAWDGLRRRIFPLLKAIYWRFPPQWRKHVLNAAYRIAGPLFSGAMHYEIWRASRAGYSTLGSVDAHGLLAGMMDLSTIAPLATPPAGRIAIHAHIFYADLATEFANYLSNMPFPYDLFISTPDEAASQTCKHAFSHLPHLGQLIITIVPNRGRDIAPMFCTFGTALQEYDYIAHIHSKKSLYTNGAADGWREYLLTQLLGNPLQIQKIFSLLSGDKNIGFIYPHNSTVLPYWANTWLSNKTNGYILCKKLSITDFPMGYFDFPAGSMFWAQSKALQPLFNAHLSIEDFPEETGQTDATLAHCIERLFVLVTRKSGHNAVILWDKQSNHWSRWRIDQYLSHKPEDVHIQLRNPAIRLVVFDIFDTLITRPLLDPESIKRIIARRIGGQAGQLYLEFRAAAENEARRIAGHDVGLDAIFKQFAALSGLSADVAEEICELEKSIELAIVSPRPETIALFKLAINLGKHVVLASDMYLPRTVIETMLTRCGINGWHKFYLSSDNRLRKDTGDFYRQLLADGNVSPHEILVIGDNEHSDVQIPVDMGFRTMHIMRPVELSRAIPRFEPVIERALNRDARNDLNKQLTLGIITQGNFHPVFYPRFDPADFVPASPWAIGFTIAGPLVLSFVQWLVKKAATDGMKRLYFLAREGQILKIVYDLWVSGKADAVASEYLVLSRRAITVPMISNLDDIFKIACTHYAPNPMPDFIFERYGLNLSDEECEELARRKIWPMKKMVSVEEENIDHLKPLLQALEERILKQAEQERPGLMAYLDNLGLNKDSTVAIVDIGYAATTQKRLNQLLGQKIHGYYLMTLDSAEQVALKHQVIAQGYYCHYAKPTATEPIIYRKSFTIEKFLSADDAQIVCYRTTNSTDITPEFRAQSNEERQTAAARAEIRRGILDFVNQSINLRDNLLTDFEVPREIAEDLFLQFIKNPSGSETDLLRTLVLDDYYYGHGLVR
ncbi:putative HAD superfamily hydrolase [Nitrosomonas oligotropha]|uniref:Putative HAD superfamily hydrolase n=1 Tax=Nitrosomonas oligotropha TaxID=42354 RepID=A0A2T5I469_9PROT|nr:rhamnan synthesis F family protein [Nitrosomonas oligotropha]PTQ78625.1 putative HAD superfamily hydrolase [Nitrosomonas oligotropha]